MQVTTICFLDKHVNVVNVEFDVVQTDSWQTLCCPSGSGSFLKRKSQVDLDV